MKFQRLSFPEALKELARRYRIELPESGLTAEEKERLRQRELLYRLHDEAGEIYHRYLLEAPAAQAARDYLARREVPRAIIESYKLGYAPDPSEAGWSFLFSRLRKKDFPVAAVEQAGLAVRKENGEYYDRFRGRVLFPIIDQSGRLSAFGGRLLGEGKPKYLNSPETPIFDKSRLLFGLFHAKEAIRLRRRAIVVEGYFDLLLLAIHGLTNVVAPLGTALTQTHIRALRGYADEVVLLFDGDSAGLKAATRSIPLFLAEQVNVRVALLPREHDPDSLVREQGVAAIEALIEQGMPLPEFFFSTLVQQYGMTLEGKNKILAELQQLVKGNVDATQRSLLIAHFSEKLGLHTQRLGTAAGDPGPVPPPPPVEPGVALAPLPLKQRQIIDFLIIYPEFFAELAASGLEEALQAPAARIWLECFKQLAQGGDLTSGTLLALLPGPAERQYVAELLIRNSGGEDDEQGTRARLLCNELQVWLKTFRHRQSSSLLQQRIAKAQQCGDTKLLMELMEKKQEMRKIFNS